MTLWEARRLLQNPYAFIEQLEEANEPSTPPLIAISDTIPESAPPDSKTYPKPNTK